MKGSGVFFDPQKIESPGKKDEILQIVRYAIENRQKLRVLGSGHSRSKIALSDDIIVSLHRFKGVTKLNKQTKQVRTLIYDGANVQFIININFESDVVDEINVVISSGWKL